jgi:hypothetical protein
MQQKTKELWVIPIIITLGTGIPLTLLGLWLSGTPIHPSFSFSWMKVALSASLPMWVTLAVVLVAAILTGLFLRQRAKTAEQKALTDVRTAEIERLRATEPKLHGVWNQAQTFWTIAKQGETLSMQIVLTPAARIRFHESI